MTIILKKGISGDEINEKLKQINESRSPKHDFDKYVGTVKISGDPLEIQKRMRNEWE
ncbi:hypothetical protein [Persicitalea sp.]|uniref:hypothetical protein n=1 Tax=Persicitalea sp. TaxID=3100273 RepID=UPI0035934531